MLLHVLRAVSCILQSGSFHNRMPTPHLTMFVLADNARKVCSVGVLGVCCRRRILLVDCVYLLLSSDCIVRVTAVRAPTAAV